MCAFVGLAGISHRQDRPICHGRLGGPQSSPNRWSDVPHTLVALAAAVAGLGELLAFLLRKALPPDIDVAWQARLQVDGAMRVMDVGGPHSPLAIEASKRGMLSITCMPC